MDRDKIEDKYIQEFAKIFEEKVKYLVQQAIENKTEFINQNDLNQEVIQHANHCINLTKKMSDSHKMYSGLANYLMDDQNTCPFVLAGPSGAGKSSLMAFVAKKVIFLGFLSILNFLRILN